MTARSLAEWLAYFEQLHPQAIDLGLERVSQVAQRLGLTRPARRVVTVTGTNGKGSTCAVLAALLTQQGQRVGLYTSPHLCHYAERIQIAGQSVTDAALCQCFAQIEHVRADISLTYFEFGTLAALSLFQQADLDVAILEVGLGGRLDAVNVVDPDLSIVTSIDLDHAEWLGSTRESVALEKAGIFRARTPIVCGDVDPPVTLLEAAQSLQAPLWIRGRDFDAHLNSDGLSGSWWGHTVEREPLHEDQLPVLAIPLANVATALQAMAVLEPNLAWLPDLTAQLSRIRVVGRFDHRQCLVQGQRRHLMLDVGHNPHAARYLAQYLVQHAPKGQWRAVFGLLSDKDLHGVLEPLIPHIRDWAVATLDTPRARPASSLVEALTSYGVSVTGHDALTQALTAQAQRAQPDDIILVFGSFYCVAEGLAWLNQQDGECVDDVAR